MHVTYGRERIKTARRATADIVSNSAQRGLDEGRNEPLAAYIITADGCTRSFLPNPPASTDAFISSQHRARDLIRMTHKLHRLSNITCSRNSESETRGADTSWRISAPAQC